MFLFNPDPEVPCAHTYIAIVTAFVRGGVRIIDNSICLVFFLSCCFSCLQVRATNQARKDLLDGDALARIHEHRSVHGSEPPSPPFLAFPPPLAMETACC